MEHMELIQRIARAKMKEIQVSQDKRQADLLEMKKQTPSEFGITCNRRRGMVNAEALAKDFYDDFYSADAWYKPKSRKRRQQQYWWHQLRSSLQAKLQFEILTQIGSKDPAFINLICAARFDPEWFVHEFFDWTSIMKEEAISEVFFKDWLPDPKKLSDILQLLPAWTQSLFKQAAREYPQFLQDLKKFESMLREGDKEGLTKKQIAAGKKSQAVQVFRSWRRAAAHKNAVKSLIGEDAMELLRKLAFAESHLLSKLPPPTMELTEEFARVLDDFYWSRRFRQALKVSSVALKDLLFASPVAADFLLGPPWTSTSEGPTASVPLPKIVAKPAESAEPLYQAVQALREFQRMRRGCEGLIYSLRSKRSASQNGFEMLAQMAHRLPETVDALEDAEVKASRAAVFAARMNSSYLDYLVAQALGEYPSAVSFEDGVTASVEDILTIDHWAKVYSNLTHNESNMLNDSDFEVNNGELLGMVDDLCASNSSLLALQNGSIFAAVCGRSGWTGAGGLLVNITASRNETLVTYAHGSALSANDTKELLREIIGALVPKDSA